MAPIRNTPSQPAASYSQIVTKTNKDGAHKQYSIPFCHVTFPISYKRKNKDGAAKQFYSSACRVTFPASYNRKKNKDGAHKKHSIPFCRVTFPARHNRRKKDGAHKKHWSARFGTFRHWMEDFAEIMLAAKKRCQ
jgi:hypothetical protein